MNDKNVLLFLFFNGQGTSINLAGVAIGNGWTDPRNTYLSYADYARKHNLVNDKDVAHIRKMEKDCQEELDKNPEELESMKCELIINYILSKSRKGGIGCLNMYDIRLRDGDSNGGCGLYSWPPLLKNTTDYLAV